MGRPSKLSPDQWAEAARRLIDGESERSVARAYGISGTTLREHLAKTEKLPTVQKVAAMLVESEAALLSLPVSAQVSARNLADRLRSISESLASAADVGARTSHRLAVLAQGEVDKLEEDEEPAERLKGVAALTRVANEAAAIGLGLLSANKEAVKGLNDPPPDEQAPQRPQVSREEWMRIHGDKIGVKA